MKGITTLPQLNIQASGKQIPETELQALQSVRVQQRLSLPTLCELTFTASPEIGNLLALGTDLRVTVRDERTPLFVGQVTAVSHNYGASNRRTIHIRAYDLLHQLRKRQDAHVFVQVTPHELAVDLVKSLGLTVQATESGPLWSRLYQHNQPDLELLADVCERCGLYLTLRDNVLHLLTLTGSGQPQPLALGSSLLEASIELNGDLACRSVTAVGWDPLRAEEHIGTARNGRSGRSVKAKADPNQVGADGHISLFETGTINDDHARLLAQAELDRRLAAEVTLRGVAEGNPVLQPGVHVVVSGVEPSLAGQYVLTEVTHLIDAQVGYVSEISTAPPPPRRRPKGAVMTLGIVTQVNDPAKIGRVKVRLPAYSGLESDWMGVASVGAGKGKGLIAIPDVGDTVLILLTHEDPGRGVVVGGLYGMDGPPDSGVKDGAIRSYTFLTPGGQRVRLDDAEQTIRLENSLGSYVSLSPEKVLFHAAADLDIEAPGQTIVIRSSAIDFQRG